MVGYVGPEGFVPLFWEVLVQIGFSCDSLPFVSEFLWYGLCAVIPLSVW